VFLNEETGTHVVLYNQEKVEGSRVVFGPDAFDACIAWVNSRGGARARENYWVFRNHTAGTLLVLWAGNTSFDSAPLYGPDTLDNCLEWARINASRYPSNPCDQKRSG